MSFRLTADVLEICCRSPARKLVLLCLAHHAQNDGTRIYPGLATIAAVAEITERSVRRMLVDMVKIGLLSVVESGGGRGRSTQYALNVEMVAWLREGGLDLGALIASRQRWPTCRDEMPSGAEKPGHSVRVSEPETRTLVTLNPDSGDTKPGLSRHIPPHPPKRINLSGIDPDPPTCAPARAREEAAAAGDESFEDFKASYPKPREGEWHVWGEVEFTIWPLLDLERRRQVIASLPAFAADVAGSGRRRLCNPAHYIRTHRDVDYAKQATISPSEEQAFVRDDSDIWPYLQDIWRQDNPDRPAHRQHLGSPKTNNGWYFFKSQIARAHKRREDAEAGRIGLEEEGSE